LDEHIADPLPQTDLRREEEEDGLRRIVRKSIPEKAKESNWLSSGPRKELKTGPWKNLRGYTRARAKEHEDDGLTTLVDNLTRAVIAIFAGGNVYFRANSTLIATNMLR
jgi:hypothetical protein